MDEKETNLSSDSFKETILLNLYFSIAVSVAGLMALGALVLDVKGII